MAAFNVVSCLENNLSPYIVYTCTVGLQGDSGKKATVQYIQDSWELELDILPRLKAQY
jgi:hypothetical protein